MAMKGRGGPWRRVTLPILTVVAIFIVSRVLLALAGVAVHDMPISGAWQLIDPALLQHDLLRSLFYLHSQPPVYNLFIGVLMKMFPNAGTAAFVLGLVYAVLGLLLALSLYTLMRRLQVNVVVAVLATALFTLSPAAILYENYPGYTHPAAVLVCVCAVLFERTVTVFTARRALALFMAMTLLIYLRSLFQVEWFLVLAAFCWWVLPGHRREVALAALLPLVLIGALYAKNAGITGKFSTSSWLGMSLAKLTTMQMPERDRQTAVARGELSSLALIGPFSGPERYPEFVAAAPVTGILVLDRTHKSTGAVNFNHIAYPAISQGYFEDALTVIGTRPELYLDSMMTAYLMYFRPSADYPFLQENRVRIEPLARLYNAVVAGQPDYPSEPGFHLREPGTIGYFLPLGIGLCVLYGVWLGVRFLRQRGRASHTEIVLLFLWLNILYVTVVGNALEMDENQRFRFLVNPLLVVMLAALVVRIAPGIHVRVRRFGLIGGTRTARYQHTASRKRAQTRAAFRNADVTRPRR